MEKKKVKNNISSLINHDSETDHLVIQVPDTD